VKTLCHLAFFIISPMAHAPLWVREKKSTKKYLAIGNMPTKKIDFDHELNDIFI
jgi:hypothetical protein